MFAVVYSFSKKGTSFWKLYSWSNGMESAKLFAVALQQFLKFFIKYRPYYG